MKGNARRTLTGAIVLFVSLCVFITVTVFVYAAAVERYADNTAAISGIMLVCVVFFALACTVIDTLRRRIYTQRPLKDILDATKRIAEGDFNVSLEIDKPRNRYNEFDFIKENINAMARALADNKETGEQFIANASHELKTPVAVIQSYSSALRYGNLTEEQRTEYADTLVETSRKMAATIENILKLNKLENGRLLARPVTFAMDENIAQCVLTFEDAIEKKNITLDCNMDEVKAHGYPDYLTIVWSNLLSNAIKFCDDGGHIAITLKQKGVKAVFAITDDGCGISPEAGKKIFDKFYQGDTSHSAEGNGLGLAMVKKVLDILGGEIKVQSQAGNGTTFTVKLDTDERITNG